MMCTAEEEKGNKSCKMCESRQKAQTSASFVDDRTISGVKCFTNAQKVYLLDKSNSLAFQTYDFLNKQLVLQLREFIVSQGNKKSTKKENKKSYLEKRSSFVDANTDVIFCIKKVFNFIFIFL